MGHHDIDSAIPGREAGNTLGRTIRIFGIVGGGFSAMIDEAEADQWGDLLHFGSEKFGSSLAVSDGDGQAGSLHAAQQNRGTFLDLDEA
jgi:hypothetical protein